MSEEASPQVNNEENGGNESPNVGGHEMDSPGQQMEGENMEGSPDYGRKKDNRLIIKCYRRGHGRRYERRRWHGS